MIRHLSCCNPIYLKPLYSGTRLYYYLCIFLYCWFIHSPSYALDLPKLPLVPYQTEKSIELAGNDTLQKILEQELANQRQNSYQLKLYKKPDKIGRYESQLLTTRLRAEGFYAATVSFYIRDGRPVYSIEPGPQYHVEKIDLQIPKGVDIQQNTIKIQTGDPLLAESVLSAKKTLATHISSNHCLYQVNVNYRVVIDHQTQSARVVFIAENSPSVHFGKITFSGLHSIDENYLRARLPIKEGECFNRNRIEKARVALIQTNLLARTTAQLKEPSDGKVPVEFSVAERDHRTVSAGVGFETEEGFGISAGWEHRNLMGSAQTLSVDSHIAQNAQGLASKLILPHFQRNDQSITIYTDLEREDTDAFESKTGTLGVELSRKITPNLVGLVGIEQSLSQVIEDGEDDRFALMSLPLSLEYDRRSDSLDPQSGFVIAGRVRPFLDTHNTSTTFIKSTLAASSYFTFNQLAWKPTIAIRSAAGSITGIDREQVPANIRFYSGGGGSVRGYPFQSLGPLTDKDPDGGLSFTEISLETRLRWAENWGGVVFIDGGVAYEEDLPQWGEDLRWGTGVGLRYYTSFAPIRFDIGIPLNKRDGIDDDFQLYISIGQAF